MNKDIFKNHIAFYHHYGPYEFLIWKSKDYELKDRIDYVFNRMTSTLSISGDLGSAVLSWNTTGNTLDNIVDYSKSLSYFVGKMETSDDKYEYDSDALEKELSDYLGLNDEEEYSPSLEDRQEMKQDLIECFDEFTGEYNLDSDLRDKLTDFDSDWWEGIPNGRPHSRHRLTGKMVSKASSSFVHKCQPSSLSIKPIECPGTSSVGFT